MKFTRITAHRYEGGNWAIQWEPTISKWALSELGIHRGHYPTREGAERMAHRLQWGFNTPPQPTERPSTVH